LVLEDPILLQRRAELFNQAKAKVMETYSFAKGYSRASTAQNDNEASEPVTKKPRKYTTSQQRALYQTKKIIIGLQAT
jgi:hypothetical protein